MLVLYPTLRARSQWLGPVITRFDTRDKEVWLTIDDGPDEHDTEKILEILERHGARATFFVKGERLARMKDLGRKIVVQGSSIANHSYAHPSGTFWCLPPRRIAAEIDQCNAVIREITGETPEWFRAPVGMKNPAVHPLLARRGMTLIAWTARGFDGVGGDPTAVADRICADVKPGTIILMHEGVRRGETSISLAATEQVLSRLTSEGYRFVIPMASQLRSGNA